jgi:hypothetical protein
VVSKGVVLDLCGGTGAWSKPYREAGYEVHVITLPDCDITETLFYDKIYFFSPGQCRRLTVSYSDIVGILAAPPCTEFSVAKGARPRNLAEGMEVVEACMRIIWEVQKRTKLDFWALENPRGLLRRFLGIPKYTFEQWQFRESKLKATDIWGYFNIPTPSIKVKPDALAAGGRAQAADWTLCEYPPEYEVYIKQFHGDERRAAARAITPAGFAEAFYRANRPKER